MLTATGSQLILDVLALFQTQDKVFTAYDVTQVVRTKTHENIHHADVQNLVHDQWFTGDFDDNYLRDDMVQLNPSGQPFAIVYYPDIKKSSDHPLALNQGVSSTPAIQPQPAPYQHPITGASSFSLPAKTTPSKKLGGATKQNDGSYRCKLTAEGRVNIPKDLVSKVDKSGGGNVDVLINGTITFHAPNRDGRLRINLLSRGFDKDDSVVVNISDKNTSISVYGVS